jgi:aldehyde:ferredoxin oxidoreductase
LDAKCHVSDLDIRIACIRPAGEIPCKTACALNELRAAGRKGHFNSKDDLNKMLDEY